MTISLRSPRGTRFRPVAALFAFLLLLVAAAATADPTYEGPILPGLDPLIRFTDDPRLLGADRLLVRERLLAQGVDPVKGEGMPDLRTLFRAHWRQRLNVDMVREEVVVEPYGLLGIETTFRYPEWFFLFRSVEELPGGFHYYPARDAGADVMDLFVDDLTLARQRRFAVASVTNRMTALSAGVGSGRHGDGGLINLTIPISFPRTLEKIIGRGEKTNIRISGREHISISGESTVSNKFTPNEYRQSQSLFPSLDMEQQLQINLAGQIGEKIKIDVSHNSEAFGPEATQIQLRYEGGEDEIIHSIETGDVGLTLPGSQLLGYSSNKSGLFGIKVTGQVGRADFTVVASKQKAESSSKSFSSQGGSLTEHAIDSNRYLNNRFFRLDLPTYLAEVLRLDASSPGREPDSPGRDPGLYIDTGSIRIYQWKTSRPLNNALQYAVAIPDPTGVWHSGLADNEAEAAPGTQAGEWWQRIMDFDLLLDQNQRLVAVDLRRQYGFNDALAVSYDVRNPNVQDADGRDVIAYRVGNVPGEDDGERVDWAGDGVQYYRLKLLKPAFPAEDPHSWYYVLRNIYSLGGTNINASTFEFSIIQSTIATNPQLDWNDITEQGSNLDLFRIFGLDQMDQQNVPGADGLPDINDPYVFDLAGGLLKFPYDMPEPFNADPATYEEYAASDAFVYEESVLSGNEAPGMYLPNASENELYNGTAKFKIVVKHAAASSSFNLGVMNIEEGSETVTLNGRTLVKDQDYTIDYTFGDIQLKGSAANELTADSQISVNYQYAPFLGGGNSSLVGLNMGFDLGRDSRMSTTWLYESNQVVGHKAKLGEEPSRTLVGNVNGQFLLKPSILTSLANLLSRRDSDRESTVQLNGEVALSIPNPNTFGDAHVEDFEGIDSSDLMPISRLSWNRSSEPAHEAGMELDPDHPGYDRYAYMQDRDYRPESRLETRWYLPAEPTQRRLLNPDLREQEGREAQQVLQMHVRTPEAADEWTEDSWGGLMRGLGSTGIDLTRAQFLEFWVNDFRHDVLGDSPSGTLHFDFGNLSEDFHWNEVDGALEIGVWDQEQVYVDGVSDGVFTADEDVGLDGVDGGADHFEVGSRDSYDPNDPYPHVNGTDGNNREDTEDLDGDSIFDQKEGFFTLSVDLADSALVDVLRDYPASEVSDNIEDDRAWRKYRLRLGEMVRVLPAGGVAPSLANVTHMRIWFEDDEASTDQRFRDLQFSEIKFLGSRWEREGVRRIATAEDPDEQILAPGERGTDEGFFLGEVNNKENPDYDPPFDLYVLNNIPEKESSLVVDVRNLEPEHMVRTSRLVSPRGDDYTRYSELSWFVHSPSADLADVDLFFRVGADTLNFYEVNYRFDESNGSRSGWKEIRIDMAELSNAKLEPADPVTGWRHAMVNDTENNAQYRVRVVGAPDLRRVKRLYYGVRNTDRTTPVSGVFWFNDVKLRQVKRELGMAQRAAVQINMGDRIKVDFDWARRDAEFHGLNTNTGQGYTNEDWNLSTNFRVDDFIPLLGFRMPVSLGRQSQVQRPKYVTNSDIEILDDALREQESTVNKRENFSVRLTRPQPSGFAPLRYVLDPWTFTVSGSRNDDTSPINRTTGQNLQGSVTYDLRLPPNKLLGDNPILGKVPIVKSMAYLPTGLNFSANFTSTKRENSNWNYSLETYVPQPVQRTRQGTIQGKIDAKPLPIMDVSVNLRSDRDLFRQRKFAGINLGAENVLTQSMQIRFQPPSRLGLPDKVVFRQITALAKGIQALKPGVSFNGSFTNDHGLNVPLEDDPAGTRHLRNTGDWNVSLTVPIANPVDRLFPQRVEVDSGERQRLLRDIQNRVRRGQLDDQELRSLVDRLGERGQSADEERRLEDRIVRLAREIEEENRRPSGQAGDADADTLASGDDAPLDWDAAGLDEGGSFRLPNPATPLLALLRGTQNVKLTYTDKKENGYTRMQPGPDPGFWYRAGLKHDIVAPDSLYTARNQGDRITRQITTQVKLSRWIVLDVQYNETDNENRRTTVESSTLTGNTSKDWPDLKLAVNGLEKLGIMGGDNPDGLVRSANMNIQYKKSETVTGITETDSNPTRKTLLGPRWSTTFRSGMNISLNVTHSTEESENSGALSQKNRLSIGAQLKHSFGAEKLLSRLGLYRPGNPPKVNMDLDVQYSTDTNNQWQASDDRDGDPRTTTGRSSISVNPRFSYSITRNLSGAMRLIYARDHIKETDTTTQRFGLGVEATFTF